MKLLQLFKKHYLATTLLLLSLMVIGYGAWQLQKEKNQPTSDNSIQTENTSTQNSENKSPNDPNNPAKDELKIPEIIKPTSTNTEASLTPAAAEPMPEKPTENTNLLSGTFNINGKNYTVSFKADSNVYDVMKQLHDHGQIKVDFKNYSGLGYFVDGIDGVKSDTFRAKYWIYYINGAKAQIGISQYTLKSNDTITWKYENAE